MTEAVRVRGIERRFGTVAALRGVDLAVGADELLVVVGPTGAGKTTLLRAIAGLETPDEGTVEIGGADAAGLPPAARDVAFVFQDFSLYPDWTVRENLEFPLKAPGRWVPDAERRERIGWAAGLLKIGNLLDRPAARLSGGEMQRVAIGRAIVRRPRVFLLDEPLTNLDAKLREALRVELVRLRRELKTPMVYVTHDQAEALSMGDRVAVLAGGRVLQTGTPEEVYRSPATPAVARLLGMPPVNLFRAVRRDGWWTAGDGSRLAPAASGPPGEAWIGVRPEDLLPEGGASEALVRVVEPQGPVRVVAVEWAGGSARLLAPRSADLKPGDRIRPRPAPERLMAWPS